MPPKPKKSTTPGIMSWLIKKPKEGDSSKTTPKTPEKEEEDVSQRTRSKTTSPAKPKSPAKSPLRTTLSPAKSPSKTSSSAPISRKRKVEESSEEEPEEKKPEPKRRKLELTKKSPTPTKKPTKKSIKQESSDSDSESEVELPAKRMRTRSRIVDDSESEEDITTKKQKKVTPKKEAFKQDEDEDIVVKTTNKRKTPEKDTVKKNASNDQPKTPEKKTIATKKEDAMDEDDIEVVEVKSPKKTPEKNKTPEKKIVFEDTESEQEMISSPKRKTPEKKTTTKKESTKKEEKEEEAKPKKRPFFNKQAHAVREVALNPGSKEIPVGKPNCLKGMVFVITGNLDSLSRPEMDDLIKQYGGLIRTAVSSKTTYLVLGADPAASKLETAKKHKTKKTDEDGVLKLIRDSAPQQPKVNQPSPQKQPVVDTKELIEQLSKQSPEKKAASKTNALKPAHISQAVNNQLWVDQFAPTKSSEILGNTTQVKELREWLTNWQSKYEASTKTDAKQKKSDQFKRAVMISGVPGIGKTTSSKVVAKECGFDDVIEMNASDARNKKSLREHVQDLTDNTSLKEFFTVDKKKMKSNRTVLIMDEVDGMSGGDRGGVAELISMIKNTKIPIICICNDRSKQSLKTLLTYTLELKFTRPNKDTISKRLMEICRKMKMSIDQQAVTLLVESLHNDIRSVVNNLQLLNSQHENKKIDYMTAKSENIQKSDSQTSIFGVTQDLLQKTTYDVKDALDLYHFDSMLVPLFIAENYISITPSHVERNSQQHIDTLSKASESISLGDTISKKIFKDQNWNLMPDVAYSGVARPSMLMRGKREALRGAYDHYYSFPSSLSKGSTTTKNYNVLRGVQKSSVYTSSLSNNDMLDYLPLLRDSMMAPLIDDKKEGIQDAIEAMDEYGVTRDDLEAIDELCTFKGKLGEERFKSVDTVVKTAFTRSFNARHKAINKGKMSKKAQEENHDGLNEDEIQIVAEDQVDKEDEVAKELALKSAIKNMKNFEIKQKKAEAPKKRAAAKPKKEATKKKATSKKISLKK
ncbi:replication factor C subunit 1 [Acrasis kona]|uniref:Replication factor C subunit 1 n=1 Tax=Acrasis kona TaxID=1008807 RepID=A0AAW2YJD9_9EUKA